MARKQATQVDNKFVKGLITETTALNFPEDAATETWNCVFDDDGKVTRRLGYDYESFGVSNTVEIAPNAAMTEYVWSLSQGIYLKTFVVVQYGNLIYFYDCSDTTEVGGELSHSINLYNYPISVSYFNAAEFPCQYATGNNQLIITNKAINPLLVTYDDVNDTITVKEISIKFRDFEGLDDGLGLTERVTSNLADLITNEPAHYYNLLNQGWHLTDALTQWDTARTDMPSNVDQVLFFRSSETDSFDNARVTAYSGVMNTPAPRGHFILTLGNISRTTAMLDEGFAATVPGESAELSTAFLVTNAAVNPTAYVDTTTSQLHSASSYKTQTHLNPSTHAYYGIDLITPSAVGFVTVFPSSDRGFSLTSSNLILTLIGSNSAPTTPYDGTLLGTATVDATFNGPVTIGSADRSTAYKFVWVTINSTSARLTSEDEYYVAEVKYYSVSTTVTYARPQTCAFFAGRAWYAGIEDGSYNNAIYFSKIIQGDSDYSKCYQSNDPTSEFLSELLPDDGGVIRILEAARVLKLFAYQNSMLVFCTNGVWRIKFNTGSDFEVRKISAVNLDGLLSVADVKGVPVWWAEDGIYTIQYEANFDAFSVQSLTEETIKSFILDIPRANRKYAKAIYDLQNDVVYWLFNDTVSLPVADRYKYNKILCLNGRTGAFYPWSIGSSTASIRGGFYLRDANREEEAVIKFLTTDLDTGIDHVTAFGGFINSDYIDWVEQGDSVDYVSYFISGYKIHGETQRFSQVNYVFVFLETEEDSSCYMHAIYDYTNSGDSGKWSSVQQVYNPNLLHRDVNYRRLKVRGKGRAIQLKFSSETGKPFNLIGWSINESQNGGI